jgi:predicted MPP superfamily phosphohydrolase
MGLITILFSTCCKESNLKLNESKLFLKIGETAALMATIQPNCANSQNIRWTSGNDDIATVNAGVVTAKTVGTAIITATTENGKHTASCSVFVSFPILRIVQLCDPQLGFGGFNNDVVNLEKAVMLINELAPDMVLIAGDMVHEPINEQSISTFLNIITHIESPVLLAPGNHDMCDAPWDHFSMEGLERYYKFYGNDYSKIECKGYCIISANSHLWWTETPQELVKLHDNWLIYELQNAKNNKQPVILLTHIPLFVSSVDENDGYSNIPKTKRKELLNLCEENGVILWLAGHTHTTFRNELRGITFLNGETTSHPFDNRPLGFRLLTLFSDNNFEWEFFPLQ